MLDSEDKEETKDNPEESDPAGTTSPDEVEESRMPVTEHLDDLRGGMIRSLIAIFIGFFVTYAFCEPLMDFLKAPLLAVLPEGSRRLYYTGVPDKFFVYMKVSFIAAACLMSPYWVYEIWRFVSPGLYKRERRFALPFVIIGTVAFFVGMAFAYLVVIPYGYEFMIQFGSSEDEAIITLSQYFSLTIQLMFALGIVFELPVLLVLLGAFGFVDAKMLEDNRKYAFLLSAVIAAFATPSPDAFTMLLVMGPLYILYEMSIVGVRLVNRGQSTDT